MTLAPKKGRGTRLGITRARGARPCGASTRGTISRGIRGRGTMPRGAQTSGSAIGTMVVCTGRQAMVGSLKAHGLTLASLLASIPGRTPSVTLSGMVRSPRPRPPLTAAGRAGTTSADSGSAAAAAMLVAGWFGSSKGFTSSSRIFHVCPEPSSSRRITEPPWVISPALYLTATVRLPCSPSAAPHSSSPSLPDACQSPREMRTRPGASTVASTASQDACSSLAAPLPPCPACACAVPGQPVPPIGPSARGGARRRRSADAGTRTTRDAALPPSPRAARAAFRRGYSAEAPPWPPELPCPAPLPPCEPARGQLAQSPTRMPVPVAARSRTWLPVLPAARGRHRRCLLPWLPVLPAGCLCCRGRSELPVLLRPPPVAAVTPHRP